MLNRNNDSFLELNTLPLQWHFWSGVHRKEAPRTSHLENRNILLADSMKGRLLNCGKKGIKKGIHFLKKLHNC